MHEHFDETYGERIVSPVEARLRAGIFALGLQPEFLGQMDTEEARTVLTGMAKLVASMTHTDRTVEENRVVAGLDVAAANALGSDFRTANASVLEQVLRNLRTDSPLAAEQALRHELAIEHGRLEQRSQSLVEQMISSPLHGFSGHVALRTVDGSTLDSSLCGVELENGTVTSGLTYSGRGMLVSKLPKRARNFAEATYSLGDKDKMLYLTEDEAREHDLSAGWILLTHATSKQDPRKKAAAAYLYENDQAYEDSQLNGAHLVGTFEAVSPDDPDDVPPREQLVASISEEAIASNVVRLAKTELIKLILDGWVEPFAQQDAAIPESFLAWFRSASRGKQEMSFITQSSAGQIPHKA